LHARACGVEISTYGPYLQKQKQEKDSDKNNTKTKNKTRYRKIIFLYLVLFCVGLLDSCFCFVVANMARM